MSDSIPTDPIPDLWTFGAPEDSFTRYSDGTQVPHRDQGIYYNGVKVGEVEIHTHRRRGRDRITDVSVGITVIMYGPAPGGK